MNPSPTIAPFIKPLLSGRSPEARRAGMLPSEARCVNSFADTTTHVPRALRYQARARLAQCRAMSLPSPAVSPVAAPPAAGRRPPGPRGLPPLGIAVDLLARGLLPPLEDAWRRYGDAVRIPLGTEEVLLFCDPDHVHHVLVANRWNYVKGVTFDNVRLLTGNGLLTSDGELWQKQRQHLQPGFHARRVDVMAQGFVAPATALADEWARRAPGAAVDVLTEMKKLTFRIATTSLFRFDIGDDAMRAVASAFHAIAQRFTRVLFAPPLWVPTPDNLRLKRALRTLSGVIADLVEKRRRQPEDDVVTMMLGARDPDSGAPMPERQLYDEIVTLFLAGYETTAVTLTWTFALLAMNPEVEHRLIDELREVLGDRAPTVDDLPRLRYTRMLVEESLRLYPSTWLVARNAVADDVIGGWRVPAGSRVLLGCYFTHRNPLLWDQPERCDPERFLPERARERHKYAYYPFGGGARVCIGREFALLEGTTILATLARRFRVIPVEGHRIEPVALGTLQPRGGLPAYLVPRTAM
jgi:cytochrome P450